MASVTLTLTCLLNPRAYYEAKALKSKFSERLLNNDFERDI